MIMRNYIVMYEDCILYKTTSLHRACQWVINHAKMNNWEFWKQEKVYGRIHYVYYDDKENYYQFVIIKE